MANKLRTRKRRAKKPGKRQTKAVSERRPAAPAPSPAPAGLDAQPYTDAAVSPVPGAITLEEFNAMARDPDVPDRELRKYFTIDRSLSRPFRPAVHLDPTLVRKADGSEVRAEGLLDWANGFSRWRRQDRFRRRIQKGEALPILVSEGDSWFQFPIFLEDVIDHFDKPYLIWSVDAAGDTLENMVRKFPEYLAELRRQSGKAKAFLFSGGGNDLVGEDGDGRSILEKVLKPFATGKKARWYLETQEYATTLASIEGHFREVLNRVAAEFPGLPVIIHGYDYAIPGPAPNEWRRPAWAGVDQWLGRALRARGILDHKLQREIIKTMIDDLNEAQKRLCGEGHAGAGKFKDAYHVDVRGALNPPEWADELHPTDAGFKKVAAVFAKVLKKAGL